MHGREGEERKPKRHMWPIPVLDTTVASADLTTVETANSFCKDGRKISVGDCALFKAPQETAPPFIGRIRWLSSGKEGHLKLGVNWLYRPADVKLGKGVLLEAAPNEVFYSFHKDEILAASLLHPCKVSFLRKGVELPPGLSSFVCRRVYDTTNRRLWWLTDKDYVNERQEEVDQLLDKTRLEMHAAVQSGGRSPKPLNGPTSMQQLKSGSDGVQNSATTFPSQIKGKKRGRGDQGSEPIKRERSLKTEDGDSGNFRLESMLKMEIAKITDRGGLLNYEGVEKLVQLMQPDRAEKKIDLSGRILFVDVIAATDRYDCLRWFLQLKGLPILDEWLQDVHKGKIGDGSSPKESDKSAEEFLLASLRALDKLPVNLNALKTCNVGKSVNHLRSHKNLEIQKKARSLVDTWKKRVDAEMIINDGKSGSSQANSWPSKPGLPEVSHGGSKRTGGSSEVPMKNSITQYSASKTAPAKLGHGDSTAKSTSAYPGSMKQSASMPASVAILRDLPCKMDVRGGTSDLPPTVKEEKSSGSSQSQNNSQSYSSDHAKTVGSPWKEDARSSTAGSMNTSKTSSGASRNRKSNNTAVRSAVSVTQKETTLVKCGSLDRKSTSEKASQVGLTCERTLDLPLLDHGNNHRLIVRLPNSGRSPGHSVSGGSFDDPTVMVSGASSPGLLEKQDCCNQNGKVKDYDCRANIVADVNTESWQGNDIKDGMAGSDEADGSPASLLDEEQGRNGNEIGKSSEASKATCSSSGNNKGNSLNELGQGKLYESSFSSINALIEVSASMPAGDDTGMNLLARVAAGEMSKSDLVSPIDSPRRSSPVSEDSFTGNDENLRLSRADVAARSQGEPDTGAGGDTEKRGTVVDPLRDKSGLQPITTHSSTKISGNGKISSSFSDENPTGENNEHFHVPKMDLQQITPCLASVGIPDETLTGCTRKEGEGVNLLFEKRKAGVVCWNDDDIPDSKPNVKSPLDEIKKFDHADVKNVESSTTAASNLVCSPVSEACNIKNVASVIKVEKEAVDESSCLPLGADGKNKDLVHEGLGGAISTEHKQSPVMNCSKVVEGNSEDAVLPSGLDNIKGQSNTDEFRTEKIDGKEVRTHTEQSHNKGLDQACKVSSNLDSQVATEVGSIVSYNKNGGENSEIKEIEHHYAGSAPHDDSPAIPAKEIARCVKPSEADESEECASTAEASLTAAAGSDMASKLDFDLNEGFLVDEGNQGDPVISVVVPECSSFVPLPAPSTFPLSSTSGSVPASITVAAAAKGPFVPPENPLRNKGEIGWKGSAATSAFRRAEPRKVLEMPLSTTDIPPETVVGKQGRPPLDIDLNVPDERILEDVLHWSSAQETGSESGLINNRDMDCCEMFGSLAPIRSTGILDLDLNKIDEGADIGQFSASTSRRLEAPVLSVRPSSSSGGLSNSEVNVFRDFDLNNGPGLDEVGTEPVLPRQHVKGTVPFFPPVSGFRINNTELGSLSSWFPSGNSYPAVAIPSILQDRGEQSYPIVSTAGTHRVLGSPAGATTFGPDVFRGTALSSSPAMAFPPTAQFPYPGLPFGPGFPSTSFSSGSTTYMDASTGGALRFPVVPSQLVGAASTVPSHFPRPYMINLPDGTTNGVIESSRKWGRQGLDLNAGPGGTDMELRGERLSSASRQLPVTNSQVLVEEQMRMFQAAGGVLKRKEPEGGWDAERFTYKLPSRH